MNPSTGSTIPSTILDALSASIALLDGSGRIVQVNESWRAFARANSPGVDTDAIGANYLEVCAGVRGAEKEWALAASAGIESVLSGKLPKFALEYPCHSPEEKRWFELTATPVWAGESRGAVLMHLNVTERKVAEEQRERIFDLSLDLICVANFGGHFERVNPAWTASLGWKPEELTSAPWIEFVHPDDRVLTVAALKSLIEGRAVRDFENRYRCKDGSYRWLSWNSQGALESGQIVAVARDVTERKAIERALAENNRTLKLLSRCNEAVIRSETEQDLLAEICRIAVENGGYRLAWVGYADESQKDRNAFVLRASAGAVGYLAEWGAAGDHSGAEVSGPARRALQSSEVVVLEDLEGLGTSGAAGRATEYGFGGFIGLPLRERAETFGVLALYPAEAPHLGPAEFRVLRELADDVALGIVSHRNRADRDRAEEQLKEQAALLDNATDAIFVRDLENRIRYWNKGAERVYGWRAEEVLGKDARKLLHGANAGAFEEASAQLLAKGEWIGEMQKLSKTRKEITVQARWTLLRDEGGAPQAVLAINTDISEKKKLEAQFLRAQRMENIGTLAGGIAHDLNNVLAPIMMSLDILKTRAPDPESQVLIDTVMTSAQRGADLVRQLLSFGRGRVGQRIPVDPSRILRDIEKIVGDTFPKSIQVEFTGTREPWPVVGDPTQFHQVLLNLCVNALDAMPNGGNLRVELKNVELDEVYSALNPNAVPGRYLLVTVADTGGGIAPELQEKVFEPFFTTKEPGKGTGLGLSTALSIVKSHGGFIELKSQPRRGTRFSVYLPAAAEDVTAPVGETLPVQITRAHGERILVVDDETSIREVCQKVLEAWGYKVVLASNGAEAVSRYAQNRESIAAVITDVAMPLMDGPALLLALRMINPAVTVIASSGLAAAPEMLSSAGGANAFLPKPYTAQQLLMTLQAVLSKPGNAELSPLKRTEQPRSD